MPLPQTPASPRVAYKPDPRFAALGPDFSDAVEPAKFPSRTLRFRNERWAARIGLGALTGAEWEAHFARFEPLPDNMNAPLAMRYHGHQFGVYNPEIGDGRGFLFAQLRDDSGRLLDLATKGSGQTPYSRFGDGRLTLKGGVREVLATEMLEALGVYTSKSFALYETGEALERHDEPSPTRGSVLTRLGHSHIRFGTFQRAAAIERSDMVETLVAHCLENYYPTLNASSGAPGLLGAVVHEAARLAASWMAAGFVHGVLNTDNMTITGESMDYGPWRFLPVSDPNFVAAYFDEGGRYRFGQQPNVVSWNLAQLASALATVTDTKPLIEALQTFPDLYRQQLRAHMFQRLGLALGDLDADIDFMQDLFGWMTETGIGWDQFFHDWFCGGASAERAMQSPRAAHYGADFSTLRALIEARAPVRPERLDHEVFSRREAITMVIDEVEGLWAPIAEKDDWSLFHAKLDDVAALREALDFSPRAVLAS